MQQIGRLGATTKNFPFYPFGDFPLACFQRVFSGEIAVFGGPENSPIFGRWSLTDGPQNLYVKKGLPWKCLATIFVGWWNQTTNIFKLRGWKSSSKGKFTIFFNGGVPTSRGRLFFPSKMEHSKELMPNRIITLCHLQSLGNKISISRNQMINASFWWKFSDWSLGQLFNPPI